VDFEKCGNGGYTSQRARWNTSNVKNNASAQETRRKLIEAAGQVFAERGLHAATIKEITDLAAVNTAAINYHFSDKYELYAAVVRHAISETVCMPPPEKMVGSPAERLRAFIEHTIRDLWDPTRPTWRATLMAHEFHQPTAAMEAILDDLIRPRVSFVHGLIRDLLGQRASDDKVARGAFSVVAQCLFYLHGLKLLNRVEPEVVGAENADKLAAHITAFSLAGLQAMIPRQRRSTLKA
jgi:TetR/AcrR family transcriptional regulator, regulator of cefoperazone and chloramphenicol sensitivity